MDFITMITKTSHSEGWALLVHVMELFYNDQAFYKAAFQIEGQNSFREYFSESMVPIISFFLNDVTDDAGDDELFINMFGEAYISIIEHWLNKGCRQTPDELVGRLRVMLRAMARKMMESDSF